MSNGNGNGNIPAFALKHVHGHGHGHAPSAVAAAAAEASALSLNQLFQKSVDPSTYFHKRRVVERSHTLVTDEDDAVPEAPVATAAVAVEDVAQDDDMDAEEHRLQHADMVREEEEEEEEEEGELIEIDMVPADDDDDDDEDDDDYHKSDDDDDDDDDNGSDSESENGRGSGSGSDDGDDDDDDNNSSRGSGAGTGTGDEPEAAADDAMDIDAVPDESGSGDGDTEGLYARAMSRFALPLQPPATFYSTAMVLQRRGLGAFVRPRAPAEEAALLAAIARLEEGYLAASAADTVAMRALESVRGAYCEPTGVNHVQNNMGRLLMQAHEAWWALTTPASNVLFPMTQ